MPNIWQLTVGSTSLVLTWKYEIRRQKVGGECKNPQVYLTFLPSLSLRNIFDHASWVANIRGKYQFSTEVLNWRPCSLKMTRSRIVFYNIRFLWLKYLKFSNNAFSEIFHGHSFFFKSNLNSFKNKFSTESIVFWKHDSDI